MEDAVQSRVDWYKSLTNQFHEWIQQQLEHHWITVSEHHMAHCFLMETNKKVMEYKEDDEELTHLQEIQSRYATFVTQYGSPSLNIAVKLMIGTRKIQAINESNKQLNVYSISTLWDILESVSTVQRVTNTFPSTETVDCGEFKICDVEHKQSSLQNFKHSMNGIYICFTNTDKQTVFHVVLPPLTVHEIPQLSMDVWVESMIENRPNQECFEENTLRFFLKNYLFKMYLFSNNPEEIYLLYHGYFTWSKQHIQQSMNQMIRSFLAASLTDKFDWIYRGLLFQDVHHEWKQMVYILFDLMSKYKTENIEYNGQPLETPIIHTTWEQSQLFYWLPFPMKRMLRRSIKDNFEKSILLDSIEDDPSENLPMEQRIHMMKTSESVKRRAITKWREVKLKSDEHSSKAKQYVEGLLKIPFGTYKQEPCLSLFHEIDEKSELYETIIQETVCSFSLEQSVKWYQTHIVVPTKRKHLMELASFINNACDMFDLTNHPVHTQFCKYYSPMVPLHVTGKRQKKIHQMVEQCIQWMLENVKEAPFVFTIHSIYCFLLEDPAELLEQTHINPYIESPKKKTLMYPFECFEEYKSIQTLFIKYESTAYLNKTPLMSLFLHDAYQSKNPWNDIQQTMNEFHTILEDSIHGHEQPKRQLERVLGQWMRGDQIGHCFGFEGPPGVGKTSLAKYGLAKCLKDENGEPRPFSFIAMGGSTHGNTLEGHNYTYLGSTWGKLVDILMETKCMNPIIFIDELDKVSRTEQGREIIGILTHLVDPTQNSHIQDKYFNGIDIDFSKALIIFSYNDVEAIDSVLLDRIHRVKFQPLSVKEKCVIAKKYILPELRKSFDMKLPDFSEEMIKTLITTYTQEAGVRKFKEIMFEIVSEYNLESISTYGKPDELTIEKCQTYLKERHPILIRQVKDVPYGIVNGMWANSLGNGGVITIETTWCPSKEPLQLTLTGSQGDVMRESMTVARSVAWNMLSEKAQEKLMERHQGIHVHCPEGATPKDGPSAGAAISLAMLSLMTKKPVPHKIAITGELSLNNSITAIGGLESKVLGAIRTGVDTIYYPVENERDMKKIREKYTLDITTKAISSFHELLDEIWSV